MFNQRLKKGNGNIGLEAYTGFKNDRHWKKFYKSVSFRQE